MNIAKLLEYQEADKEMQKLKKSLMLSEEAKSVSRYKKKVTEAIDELTKLDRASVELMNSFESQVKKLKAAEEKIGEFSKVIEEVDDLKEIDYVDRKLDELISECRVLSRDISGMRDTINSIKGRAVESQKAGSEAQNKGKESRNAFEKLRDKMNPEAKAIQDRLDKLEKEIKNPDLISRYNSIKSNGVFPVIVSSEHASCMGCGMNIANDIQIKLKNKKELAECPNCGRLMYLKE